MFRKKCLFCQSESSLVEILNLGMHPFADTFIPPERASDGDVLYPLICDLCTQCKNVQLRTVTDPTKRYTEYNYSYTSSNSKTAMTHWNNYKDEVLWTISNLYTNPVEVPRVLEIGCNDGYLSEQFQKAGCEVTGIDASPAMCEIATAKGINTRVGLFGSSDVTFPHKFDLIVANNVFNHSDDPYMFAFYIRTNLASGGTFVFEMPYWATSLKDNKFDQVYHEHVTYLSVSSAVNLFKSVGLPVYHVEEVDYHGGSIRIYVGRHTIGRSVKKYLDKESDGLLFDINTYHLFQHRIFDARAAFKRELLERTINRQPIYCVGAAAKANTFLNFYGLTALDIVAITDASPHKIWKFTPGSRIPIHADDILYGVKNPAVIITSWNLSTVLQEKMLQINNTIEFLNPFDPKYYEV